MGRSLRELFTVVEAAGIGHRQTSNSPPRRSTWRTRAIGAANRPRRGDDAAPRSHAYADEGDAVRGNGATVERHPRECGDDQGDVQGLPQPGALIIDARIVAEVTRREASGSGPRVRLSLHGISVHLP